MKTLQTPVKWKLGFKGTEHTFTGYKSKTVTDTVNDFARWYYRHHFKYKDFGHALEEFLKGTRHSVSKECLSPAEMKTLRHNVIERIKVYRWSEDPILEYFQLTESVNRLWKVSATDDFCFFLHQCAGSPVKNDTPLTTPTTNDNIGFS
jgi:hypothetical protein